MAIYQQVKGKTYVGESIVLMGSDHRNSNNNSNNNNHDNSNENNNNGERKRPRVLSDCSDEVSSHENKKRVCKTDLFASSASRVATGTKGLASLTTNASSRAEGDSHLLVLLSSLASVEKQRILSSIQKDEEGVSLNHKKMNKIQPHSSRAVIVPAEEDDEDFQEQQKQAAATAVDNATTMKTMIPSVVSVASSPQLRPLTCVANTMAAGDASALSLCMGNNSSLLTDKYSAAKIALLRLAAAQQRYHLQQQTSYQRKNGIQNDTAVADNIEISHCRPLPIPPRLPTPNEALTFVRQSDGLASSFKQSSQ